MSCVLYRLYQGCRALTFALVGLSCSHLLCINDNKHVQTWLKSWSRFYKHGRQLHRAAGKLHRYPRTTGAKVLSCPVKWWKCYRRVFETKNSPKSFCGRGSTPNPIDRSSPVFEKRVHLSKKRKKSCFWIFKKTWKNVKKNHLVMQPLITQYRKSVPVSHGHQHQTSCSEQKCGHKKLCNWELCVINAYRP